MIQLHPKLNDIAAFFEDLITKGELGYFSYNDESYTGNSVFSHRPGTEKIRLHVINNTTGESTLNMSDWGYFTGYVGPKSPLQDLKSQHQLLLYLKKNIRTNIIPRMQLPEKRRESQPADTLRDGNGSIHFLRRPVDVLHYGNLEYDLKFGKDHEKTYKEKKGEKELLEDLIIHHGQQLKIVVFPTIQLAKLAYEGKTSQHTYIFGTHKNSRTVPSYELK